MKNKMLILLVVPFILLFLVFSDSPAQRGWRWHGSGGWGHGDGYGRMYNKNTVDTVKGTVVKLEKIYPMRGMRYGIHLILKTEKETISVHLGPGWYIENQDIKILKGDKIEVKGSRITYNNKTAIIAAEVKKSDSVLKLRDENGFPMWAGWRKDGGMRGMGR